MMHASAVAYDRIGLEAISGTRWRAELDWASAIPSFQAHWVRFLMEIGRRDEAREAFDAMAQEGFANVTKEIGYLNALAHLSLVAVWLHDRGGGREPLRSSRALPASQHPERIPVLPGLGFVLPGAAGEAIWAAIATPWVISKTRSR